MKRIIAALTLAALCGLTGYAQKQSTPDAQLGAIIRQAEVELDFEGAIPRYTKFIAESGRDRQLAAKALYHLGLAYEKVGSPEAHNAFQRVVNQFSDQKETATLAQARLSGTAPREMVQHKIWSGPAGVLTVSSDGRYIVRPSPMRGPNSLNSLVVHDLSSGTDRTLDLGEGKAHDPFITPDGKRVLYTWWGFKDEDGELRIVNLDGTGMRSLTRGGGYVGYDIGGVTADGKLAAVGLPRIGTWQIGLLSLETRKLQILKDLAWRNTWVGNFSPDGRWLVYSEQLTNESPDSAVYVMATDGSGAPSVVVPSGLRNARPLFTPDGSRVVFPISRSGRSELWSVRVKNGKRVGDPEFVRSPGSVIGFSPDGTLYYSETASSSSGYVVQVDPSTWKPKNAPVRISDPFRHEFLQVPYWSPDGKRLAYLAGVVGDRVEDRVVIHDFESGQDRELPTRAAKGSLSLAGWSSDGKSLLVAAPGAGLRLVDIETQQARSIPLTRADQMVASTDGKAVFYATLDSAPYERGKQPASDTLRLIRRDLDTGADKELYRTEARPLGISLTPSPDGRSLAFAFLRPGENRTRSWILALSGGEPREAVSGFSAWTQDSRAILFGRSNEIWVQPIDGGEPYATGITFSGLYVPRVSPDGGRIAFRGSTTTESVWTIKNLFSETSAGSSRLQPGQSAKR